MLPMMQIENEEPRPVSLAGFYDDYCALNGYHESHSSPSRKEVVRAYKKVFKRLLGDEPPLLQICLDQVCLFTPSFSTCSRGSSKASKSKKGLRLTIYG